eukprot:GEMP01062361.1.p1 GENE.GEMP01062361.1~~GEMP01062361.1.p1  ORF type:complete len:224 (-),score=26.02 GEMP01062361.1:192-863(-)
MYIHSRDTVLKKTLLCFVLAPNALVQYSSHIRTGRLLVLSQNITSRLLCRNFSAVLFNCVHITHASQVVSVQEVFKRCLDYGVKVIEVRRKGISVARGIYFGYGLSISLAFYTCPQRKSGLVARRCKMVHAVNNIDYLLRVQWMSSLCLGLRVCGVRSGTKSAMVWTAIQVIEAVLQRLPRWRWCPFPWSSTTHDLALRLLLRAVKARPNLKAVVAKVPQDVK